MNDRSVVAMREHFAKFLGGEPRPVARIFADQHHVSLEWALSDRRFGLTIDLRPDGGRDDDEHRFSWWLSGKGFMRGGTFDGEALITELLTT